MLINISQNILNNNVLLPFIVNPLEREEASVKLLMLNMGRVGYILPLGPHIDILRVLCLLCGSL